MTESNRPGHLAEVPLAERGLALGLSLDPGGETLLVVQIGELKRRRGGADRRDDGSGGGSRVAQDPHDGVGRHQIVERQLRIEKQLHGRSG